MTTSLDLLDQVRAAIIAGGTDAMEKVFKPGDWPTQGGQYPIIKLRLIGEQRTGLSRAGPSSFTTLATIRIIAEVSEPAQVDDGGAAAAEAALWALKRQIDACVVNDYELERSIQQIASMNSQLAFNSEAATHLAGIQTDLGLEFYEGPEDFVIPPSRPLAGLSLQATNYPPVGFDVDLQQ